MRTLAALVVGSLMLGCGTRSDLSGAPAGNFDAGPMRDGAASAQPSAGAGGTYQMNVTHGPPPSVCHAGCLCSPASDCPTGCYVTQGEQADGAPSEPFCANGIVQCGAGWAVGTPVDNCGSGRPRYVDAGPDGAFCCER